MKAGQGRTPFTALEAACRGVLLLLNLLIASALLPADQEAARAAYGQGNRLYDRDRFTDAVAAYNRALEQDPQFVEAYHNRALAEEIVDRQKAIEDWQKFVEVAEKKSDFKFDVSRANARLQLLKSMPPAPPGLQPSRYDASSGDYFLEIAKASEAERWKTFPVRMFLGSAPDIKWQQGAREAFDIWKEVFPMQLVAMPERADIRVSWERWELERGHAGEDLEWVQLERVGDELTGRRIAIIRLDLSRRWSKDEMRAIILHEMGHALGVKDHSPNRGDIMYWQMQEKRYQIAVPVVPSPFFWKSLVKEPSQRDINTLIRLYNSAGPMERFP